MSHGGQPVPHPGAGEAGRLGVLAAAAAWLLHPFATGRLYGAGDALWYANMLADFVTQLRAGIFPVFAGQTEFAFNGAVYPLRVAPMYQHLAGLIDLLTGRSLGFYALQHLTVIVCGVGGICACYYTLRKIAPDRPWCAVGFSILYLSSPGLLATVYTQDLYMTWMAVPLAPLATYGIVRSFRNDDIASQAWLAAPLAALWWAHSPIALWFTFVAGASQLVRLGAFDRGLKPLRRALLGAALFALLAQYPFVSVAEVQTAGHPSTVVTALANPGQIAENLRSVFPAAILPVSEHAGALGDIQLGYALWAVLLCAGAAALTLPGRGLKVLLGGAAVLLVLLLPVPGINRLLWGHMPAEVLRITYYWPMQRFYLILASLLAAAGQLAFGQLPVAGARAKRRIWVWVLMAGCAWSLWEARQFIRGAADRTASRQVSARSQRPENLFLTNDSYGLFGSLPPHFSNGVVNPRDEARLLAAGTGKALPLPDRRVLDSGALAGTVDDNPGVLRMGATVHLECGRRYALEIQFRRQDLQGILQLEGHSVFREYRLPSSGEALAFGSGPANDRTIALWTSDPAGDDVSIRFIPTAPGDKPEDFARFGAFRLLEVDPGREPVEVTSLMPFIARVRTGAPVLLETPRMYMPGYRAIVDGRHGEEVVRSEAGLAAVPIPPGTHTVSLGFAPPALLSISYWGAIAAWGAMAVLAALASARALLGPRS
jgi:hypothetical protein